MRKRLFVLALSLVLTAFVAGSASAGLMLDWQFAPDSTQDPGNTNSTYWDGSTLVVGTETLEGAQQPGEVHGVILGASALLPSISDGGFLITLDKHWATWDSYNPYDPNAPYGTGYWDSFSVVITEGDPYWELALQDPIDDPTLANNDEIIKFLNGPWGGESYGDGTLETYGEPLTTYTLLASELDPNDTYYINLILDTYTDPYTNWAYPSWGAFTDVSVGPVPEPATMLLLGSGLVGIGVFGRKRLFKKQ